MASRENRLVIFVGAGVSMNSNIPSWNELIRSMKSELPEMLTKEQDSLKIAQLYKDSRGHKEYLDKVKQVLLYNKAVPNDLHKIILELNPSYIITTNYDDLIEQELQKEFIQYDIIREDKNIPQMVCQNALIKMHGDFSTDNIVLTENDYYNYAHNFPLIRAYVQSLFASKLVLFVGFSFADLNLKMIMNDLQNILSEYVIQSLAYGLGYITEMPTLGSFYPAIQETLNRISNAPTYTPPTVTLDSSSLNLDEEEFEDLDDDEKMEYREKAGTYLENLVEYRNDLEKDLGVVVNSFVDLDEEGFLWAKVELFGKIKLEDCDSIRINVRLYNRNNKVIATCSQIAGVEHQGYEKVICPPFDASDYYKINRIKRIEIFWTKN